MEHKADRNVCGNFEDLGTLEGTTEGSEELEVPVEAEVPHVRRLGFRFVRSPEGSGPFVLPEVNRDEVLVVVERL